MSGQPEFEELLFPHADGATLERLARYARLLERWAARHSLVSFRGRRELVDRHLVDALAARPFLGRPGLLADVGSGAGLPGVPLLVASPGWRGILVEPRQKRWAFLRAAVRELALDATVERCRYQELGEHVPPIATITVRALAGMDHPRSRELLARLGAGGPDEDPGFDPGMDFAEPMIDPGFGFDDIGW